MTHNSQRLWRQGRRSRHSPSNPNIRGRVLAVPSTSRRERSRYRVRSGFLKLEGHQQVNDAYLLRLAIHKRGKLATVARAVRARCLLFIVSVPLLRARCACFREVVRMRLVCLPFSASVGFFCNLLQSRPSNWQSRESLVASM